MTAPFSPSPTAGLGDVAGLPALGGLLTHPDPTTRRQGAELLTTLLGQSPAQALTAALNVLLARAQEEEGERDPVELPGLYLDTPLSESPWSDPGTRGLVGGHIYVNGDGEVIVYDDRRNAFVNTRTAPDAPDNVARFVEGLHRQLWDDPMLDDHPAEVIAGWAMLINHQAHAPSPLQAPTLSPARQALYRTILRQVWERALPGLQAELVAARRPEGSVHLEPEEATLSALLEAEEAHPDPDAAARALTRAVGRLQQRHHPVDLFLLSGDGRAALRRAVTRTLQAGGGDAAVVLDDIRRYGARGGFAADLDAAGDLGAAMGDKASARRGRR